MATEPVKRITDIGPPHYEKFLHPTWPRFFELTGIPFTRYHIDDFQHAGLTYTRSTHLRL